MAYIKEHSSAKVIREVGMGDYIGSVVSGGLKGKGKSLKGECPWCNGKDKLTVNEVKEVWKCFSCGKGGKGVVSFRMEMKGEGFQEAIEALAEYGKIELEYEESTGGKGKVDAESLEGNKKMVKKSQEEKDALKKAKKMTSPLPLSKGEGYVSKNNGDGKKGDMKSFRDLQLEGSGLGEADQMWNKPKDDDKNTEVIIDRYVKGGFDDFGNVDLTLNDMLLYYMGLDGKPKTFTRKNKDFPLIRVRHEFPSEHLYKGEPIKYRSPGGSGTAVWINHWMRNKWLHSTGIKTLFVSEGEKKADKLTKHGLPTLGLMGIHNLAFQGILPAEFKEYIKRCKVENIVFFVDGDLFELGKNLSKSIDSRAQSFITAIIRFHDYFNSLVSDGINLNIYFAYVKPEFMHAKSIIGENTNNGGDLFSPSVKGADDLLVMKLKGEEHKLVQDFEKLLLHPSGPLHGKGEFVNCHKINNYNVYKLKKDFFHFETNDTFAQFHKEKLKELKSFKIGKEYFKFATPEEADEINAEGGTNANGEKVKPGDTILAQKLSYNEQFWEVTEDDYGKKKYHFKYVKAMRFLSKRGFGRYSKNQDGVFEFIQVENNIVKNVNTTVITDHICDFVEYGLENDELLEMFHKGGKAYLGDNLNKIYIKNLNVHRSGNGIQYIYFNKLFWRITAEGVVEKPFSELDGHVWKDNIIPRDVTYKTPPVRVKWERITKDEHNEEIVVTEKNGVSLKEGKYMVEFPEGLEAAMKSDFMKYLWVTSDYYWRETHSGAGAKPTNTVPKQKLDKNQEHDNMLHFLSKITAVGYMANTCFDPANAKLVNGMDGKESEVGQSNGGTGKTVLGNFMAELIKTKMIDGKDEELMKSQFMLDGVDEKTRLICFDDVPPHFKVARLFSMVTGNVRINPKGVRPYDIPKDLTPKMYITTNHSLISDGWSTDRRVFRIGFSDYFNREWEPIHEFKHRLIDDWGQEQWDLFYSDIAFCLQTYFQYGLIVPPLEKFEQRQLRQKIGEKALEFFENYFDEESFDPGTNVPHLGHEVEREKMNEAYFKVFPESKKYVDTRILKTKLIDWCQYKKYIFNPKKPKKNKQGVIVAQTGGDIKKNNVEYFEVMKPEVVTVVTENTVTEVKQTIVTNKVEKKGLI